MQPKPQDVTYAFWSKTIKTVTLHCQKEKLLTSNYHIRQKTTERSTQSYDDKV